MSQEPNKSAQIPEIIGLQPRHFADLVRAAQLVFDPCSGTLGRSLTIDWQDLGIPSNIVDNLKEIGAEYRYSSPNIPPEEIWAKLTAESRLWFINNKDNLWEFEEIFPALDED
ncbi:MAG: hypothetical protein F6K61_10880 [Sphaerospermopsis sp. SIO1G1]|nr:hypothetical protein [Sphaerospermopsis sp. SIO1G1]